MALVRVERVLSLPKKLALRWALTFLSSPLTSPPQLFTGTFRHSLPKQPPLQANSIGRCPTTNVGKLPYLSFYRPLAQFPTSPPQTLHLTRSTVRLLRPPGLFAIRPPRLLTPVSVLLGAIIFYTPPKAPTPNGRPQSLLQQPVIGEPAQWPNLIRLPIQA